MTNKEILEKAIQKAIDGGWQPEGFTYVDVEAPYKLSKIEESGYDLYIWYAGSNGGSESFKFEPSLIFNHDFAKALWGEDFDHAGYGFKKQMNTRYGVITEEYNFEMSDAKWKIKLAQMVIADDPIRYLGENI